jgi:hypothetical protein
VAVFFEVANLRLDVGAAKECRLDECLLAVFDELSRTVPKEFARRAVFGELLAEGARPCRPDSKRCNATARSLFLQFPRINRTSLP